MSKARDIAEGVLFRLRQTGYEAFLVGGCVRDLIMHREPKDYDVVTNALPETVEALFPKTIAVGKKFGIVVVVEDGVQVEVATYRADGEYKDNRHPEAVLVAKTAREDVNRRDFTMNGLLMRSLTGSVRDDIVDHVGGYGDIQNRFVRAIGNPDERFKEDALRMLRAIRFATVLGFIIEPNTWYAILANRSLIKAVSRERVRDELVKIITSPNAAKGLALLARSGLLNICFPEVMYGTFAWVLRAFEEYPTPNKTQALAMFLFGCDKNTVGSAVARLVLSDQEKTVVEGALNNWVYLTNANEWKPAAAIRFRRHPYWREAFCLLQAWALKDETYPQERLCAIERRFEEMHEGELNPVPLINGNDLLADGYSFGPKIGAMLYEAETWQLNGRVHSKEEAMEWLHRTFPKERHAC